MICAGCGAEKSPMGRVCLNLKVPVEGNSATLSETAAIEVYACSGSCFRAALTAKAASWPTDKDCAYVAVE